MTKRFGMIFILAFVFLFTVSVPAVHASGIQDTLVPQDTHQKQIGHVKLDYNQYPQGHYQLDTYYPDTGSAWWPGNWGNKIGQSMTATLATLTNNIWMLNVTLSYFAGLFVQQAFSLNFIGHVIDQISQAIQSISGFNGQFLSHGLWPALITFLIVLLGTWGAYVGMVKRETSRAFSGLLSAMIIFGLALGFFANAGKVLTAANDWSSHLQQNILSISASVITPGHSYSEQEGIASIRNQMFEIMVFKPYLMMQYGTTNTKAIKSKGSDRISNILSKPPFSNERQADVKREVNSFGNTMMSMDGVPQRAAYVPLVFLANAILGIMLLLLAGAVILYQIIFIALVLFAPVPLLIALIPSWQQTAINWALKALHALLMKVGIALLLTILFAISTILYRASNAAHLGYLWMILLQIICFVGIWVKRHDLFAVVSTASNHVQSHARDLTSHHRYKEHARKAQNTARNVGMLTFRGKFRKGGSMPLVNRERMEGQPKGGQPHNIPASQRPGQPRNPKDLVLMDRGKDGQLQERNLQDEKGGNRKETNVADFSSYRNNKKPQMEVVDRSETDPSEKGDRQPVVKPNGRRPKLVDRKPIQEVGRGTQETATTSEPPIVDKKRTPDGPSSKNRNHVQGEKQKPLVERKPLHHQPETSKETRERPDSHGHERPQPMPPKEGNRKDHQRGVDQPESSDDQKHHVRNVEDRKPSTNRANLVDRRDRQGTSDHKRGNR